MAAKGPQAYRSISEAAAELGLAPHVLRFWEQRFSFIRPVTRSGGRRFYRPEDIEVLRGVRGLLHDRGHAIREVQRLHREQGVRAILAAAAEPRPATPPLPGPASVDHHGLAPAARRRLAEVLADLSRACAAVERVLAGRPRES